VKPVRTGFFPLDEKWGLSEGLYSPALAQHMVWLSGHMPYKAAQETFQRLTGQRIPSASIWRQTQHYGERLVAYRVQQQEHVRPERVVLPVVSTEPQTRKGVSLDGGLVNIRSEGWKEVKVGAVFQVEHRWERDPQTRELVQLPHAAHLAYAAVLGSVADFAPAFWCLAVEHQLPSAEECSVTADGAEWIWNLAADYFPDSVQILDWFHACQHLAQAASALFPDSSSHADRWYAHAQETLYQGHATRIASQLKHAGLPDHARYFRTHQRRMQYHEFREDGYPIGSGTIESGVKQFKARLSGAGMRWHRPHAQRMLVIRAAVLAHDFDSLWLAAA
jgi:hypothetical protein